MEIYTVVVIIAFGVFYWWITKRRALSSTSVEKPASPSILLLLREGVQLENVIPTPEQYYLERSSRSENRWLIRAKNVAAIEENLMAALRLDNQVVEVEWV